MEDDCENEREEQLKNPGVKEVVGRRMEEAKAEVVAEEEEEETERKVEGGVVSDALRPRANIVAIFCCLFN